MFRHFASLASICLIGAVVAWPHGSGAQTEFNNNLKYNSGQSIQPVFEGWSRNPDGSFNMHFGYLNRNYVQELHIPVGADNTIEPGGPDRGQPTYFYTRTNRNLFSVPVPKDWGKKDLIWTVSANGKPEKAFGWLQPDWEIDPAGGAGTGGRTDADYVKNKPPTFTIAAIPSVTLPATAALNGTLIDDGLPKPRGRGKPAVGQETPPLLQGPADAPVNVPQLGGVTRGAGRANRPTGPTVSWIVWRGPAKVTFDPAVTGVKDGKTVTTATFTAPGEYVLRARASDTALTVTQDAKVVVTGTASK
jgi:hypothetical protein